MILGEDGDEIYISDGAEALYEFDLNDAGTTGTIEAVDHSFSNIRGFAHDMDEFYVLDGDTIKTIDGDTIKTIEGIEMIFSIDGLILNISVTLIVGISLML